MVCVCASVLYTNTPDSMSNGELIEAGSTSVIFSLLCIGDIKLLLLSRRSVLLHVTICYYPFALNSVGRLDRVSALVSLSLSLSPRTLCVFPPCLICERLQK